MSKTSSSQQDMQNQSDCNACRHLFMTYEARYPYGCRKLSFKSLRLPHYEVLEASGEPCASFEHKQRTHQPT
jgi:hypothetical protein